MRLIGLAVAAVRVFLFGPVAPEALQPVAASITWALALFLGALHIFAAVFGPGVGPGMIGLLLVALGLAVRRGERTAAWILSGLGMVAGLDRIDIGQPIAGAVAFPLAGVSLWAGFGFVRIDPSKRSREQWIRALADLAFLEAGWSFILFARAVMRTNEDAFAHFIGPVMYGGLHFIGVVMYGGLGIAALKRSLWAAYLLVLLEFLSLFSVLHLGVEWITARSGMLIVYCLGTYYLRKAKGVSSGRGRLMAKLSGRTFRS
jgi:hypothetical protein